MSGLRHIVFAGGGTAGHLFPGLAVAEAMRSTDPSIQITFAGGGKPNEQTAVKRAGFEYLQLACRRLPRRPWAIPAFVASNFAGYQRAGAFLRQNKITAVIGLGGYASAPMARAAGRQKVPLVLLEQNAVPGRVTRWLASSADLVCASIPQAVSYFSVNDQVVVTGNPVRRRIAKLAVSTPKVNKKPLLLVLGGSGGARWLNQQVPNCLAQMPPLASASKWQILHQAGADEADETQNRYRANSLDAVVTPFIDDMAGQLSRTDLVVCRAGGTTLAELTVAGVPAIAVPFPHAADDHQRLNAEAYQAMGTCQMVQQSTVGKACPLAGPLARLLVDEKCRRAMSTAARTASRPQAADDVARHIEALIANRETHRAA